MYYYQKLYCIIIIVLLPKIVLLYVKLYFIIIVLLPKIVLLYVKLYCIIIIVLLPKQDLIATNNNLKQK